MNRGVRDSRCLVDWDKDRDTNLLSNYGMLCRVGIYRVYYYLVMVYYVNNIIWFNFIVNGFMYCIVFKEGIVYGIKYSI